MTSQPQKQVPGGLGQPLVTIPPAASSISRGVGVGNDHPLAAAAPPVVTTTTPGKQQSSSTPPAMMSTPTPRSGPPAQQQQQQQQQTSSTSTPTRTASSNSSNIISTAVSPSKSLDSMADAFLSESSYRTDQLGLAPLYRPTPLPREDGIARLRSLVERRAWGDVLKIATGMLNQQKSQHADVYASLVMLPLNAAGAQVDVSQVPPQIRNETVEIMTLQCNAWLKLRRYSDLSMEVERWNFLTQNDATAQSPDWLPWSLHILAGQIQQFTDDSDRTSDVLFELRERMIPDEDAVWLTSVDNALANMFLRQSRWRLALGSYDRILELIPAATKQYMALNYPHVNNDSNRRAELEQFMAEAHRCEILSRQGRALLQIGALPQVASAFETATEVWNSIASRIPSELAHHRLVKILPVQMAMNEGLFDFSKSNYDRAIVAFSKAVELLRSDGGLPVQKYDVEDWMGPTVAGSETPTIVYTECTNNLALSFLYTCRMKDAVETLEGSIRDDAGSFLTERTVFNLCTLYELRADSATSSKRKRVLQLIAKRFFLHDVGPESFRVT